MEKGRRRCAARAALLACVLLLCAAPGALAAAPLNDDFAASSVLPTQAEVTVSGTNVDATAEEDEPAHTAADRPERSVWYSWTPPADGSVVVSTTASFERVVAVYLGDEVGRLTPVWDQRDRYHRVPESVRVRVDAGVPARIVVAGRSGGSGAFDLSLAFTPRPANDDFEDAEPLEGERDTATGSTAGATWETREYKHEDSDGEDASVWFEWTAPHDGGATVDTTGSSFYPHLSVYTGPDLDSYSVVTSTRTTSDDYHDMRHFRAEAGVTYKIALVDSWGVGRDYKVSLTLEPTPANDDLADAALIAPDATSVSGTTVGATREAGERPLGAEDAASVWYRWTATEHVKAMVAIDQRKNFPQATVSVFTGSTHEDLRLMPDHGSGRSASWGARVGTTYLIKVDGGPRPEQGFFRLKLSGTPRPANDDFDAPFLLAGPEATGRSNNLEATSEHDEPTHWGGYGEQSVWWSWTAPRDGRVTLRVADTFRWTAAVYTGSSIATLTHVQTGAGVWDGESPPLRFWVEGGTTYRIAVDSRTSKWSGVGGAGDVELSLSLGDAPRNDDLADARVLTHASADVYDTNVDASSEAYERYHGGSEAEHSVWYAWEAPKSGSVTVDTRDSSFDTRLAVYRADADGGLPRVGESDDVPGSTRARATFDAVAGAQYRIAVDGKDGATGDFVMTLRQGGTDYYDDFAEAWQIGDGTQLRGESFRATREVGEPRHAGDRGGASLWYWVRAPYDGTLRIHTGGSEFDTVLGVYTGDAVDALTEVASDDDSYDGYASEIRLRVTEGTVYRIAVDGKHSGDNTAQGIVRINVRGTPDTPPPVDPPPSDPPPSDPPPADPPPSDPPPSDPPPSDPPPSDPPPADPPPGDDTTTEDTPGGDDTPGNDPSETAGDTATGGDATAGDPPGGGDATERAPDPAPPAPLAPSGAPAPPPPAAAPLRVTASFRAARRSRLGGIATCSAACWIEVVVNGRRVVLPAAAGAKKAFVVKLTRAERRRRAVTVTIRARSLTGVATVVRRVRLR